MTLLPVPVKILFSDFPTEVSTYTISGSHTCQGMYEDSEKYIIFPLSDCPEITPGTEIKSGDNLIYIAKSVETGGYDSDADALIVYV